MLTGSTPKYNSTVSKLYIYDLTHYHHSCWTSQHAWDHFLHDLLRSFILLLLHLDASRQRDAALPARHRQPPRSSVAAVRGSQVFVLIPTQHYPVLFKLISYQDGAVTWWPIDLELSVVNSTIMSLYYSDDKINKWNKYHYRATFFMGSAKLEVTIVMSVSMTNWTEINSS